MTIKEIQSPVYSEIKKFESHFKDSMKSNVPLLDKITYYIVQRKGKQVRPLFVFLCAKLFGDIGPKTYNAASLIELLHTATLVHDDVVDDADMRRGFFSINALWKNKIAVLVGDYLLSSGLLVALDNDHFDLLKILSVAVKEMSEGELLQIEKARKLDIDEEIYYNIIRQKTASLIAASTSSGAKSVTDDPEIIQKMYDFGQTIGMAFQIKDDLFDYGKSSIGKPTGIDIKEKKMTLPLIYALNNADRKTKNGIINSIKRDSTNPKVISEVIDFVTNQGGLDYASKKMYEYRDKALEILATCPDNEASESLNNLVHFVIERNK
jgi:octaprenyl-diphosphate synthase